MRVIVATLVGLALAGGPARRADAAASVVAIYWEPPGRPAIGAHLRATFAEAVKPLGARLIDAAEPTPAPASLRPELAAATEDYARFAFAAAIGRLDELQRLADASGGGDLDRRQLSELFFFRGLCRLETAAADAAWDDLVRAARLDPARIIDPARYPPRAVTAYRRAIAEVSALPRAELRLSTPEHAVVRIDGAVVAGAMAVTLGQHFVSVSAEGYEPWAAVVAVSSLQQRLNPDLRPYRPPDGDRLLALAGGPSVGRLILGALEQTTSGWRFLARDVELPDGRVVSHAVAIGEAPSAAAVAALLRRLLPAKAVAPAPSTRRLWPWLLGGGLTVALAAGVAVGVGVGAAPASGTVAGDLGPLR